MCPYVRRSYGKYTYINYDENGQENGSVILETSINEECKREKCGVWYKGRCRYNEQR